MFDSVVDACSYREQECFNTFPPYLSCGAQCGRGERKKGVRGNTTADSQALYCHCEHFVRVPSGVPLIQQLHVQKGAVAAT